MSQCSAPGTTITPKLLDKQFYDPYKVRMKSVYQKSFCRPEFEQKLQKTPTQTQKMSPRYGMTDGSWQPGWK